jgi:chemotaxis protein methyltransferase CheR
MMADSSIHSLVLSPESVTRFCTFITCELGIKMTSAKLPMLQSRLGRRLHDLQLPSLEAYQEFLFSPERGEEELEHFINAVTTNKTDFFREPQHFEYLAGTALPTLDRHPSRPWDLKIWCAGCSSGEEPYTLAIVLSEYATNREGVNFALLATDISTRVLSHAEMAIYDTERISPVPPALRKKYFLRSKDPTREQVRVVPELRSKVTFSRLNFMDERYPVRDRFEVIFFRNVMIYFDKPTQEAVINKLCRHLKPGGYLFVGHSESLTGLNIPLRLVTSAVYRME